jgi:hypothetical protein
LKAEYEKILSKRQEVLSMLEDQMKAAQQIYERVDNKIKYFGESIYDSDSPKYQGKHLK